MKIFKILLLGLILAGVIVTYETPYSRCNRPVTYKIGMIDPKFNFRNDEALTNLEKGSQILSNAYGKQLFKYASESGELTINFVYDQRTALKSDINNMESKIDQKDASLEQQITSYETELKTFQKKVNSLNADIQKYNKSGGAPPDIYASFINQQNQLKSESQTLNEKAKQLNLAGLDFNSQVEVLNQNVNQFNQTLKEKPEEGQYDEANKTITIYFIENRQELIHLMAHEFGHVLEMDHVNNVNAIMYPYTTDTLTMQIEDKQQLETSCKEIPLLKHWMDLFEEKVLALVRLSTYARNLHYSNVGFVGGN